MSLASFRNAIFQLGIMSSAQLTGRSGLDDFRRVEKCIKRLILDYISLKIDYDYPVTFFPPIWSLIVKDLDISTVP